MQREVLFIFAMLGKLASKQGVDNNSRFLFDDWI